MGFYLIYTGMIFFLALAGMRNHRLVLKSAKNQYEVDIPWALMVMSLIIVLGFRNVATADTLAYSRGFVLMQSGDFSSSYFSYSLFYVLINKIAIAIGGNIHTVYFICACISVVFLALGLVKVECNKYLYLVLFLLTFQFFDQFNIIRQGVAMSICFFALNSFLLAGKNFKKYAIYVIIASLFHLSAIVMIPIYFIVQKKIPYSVMIAAILSVFLLSNLISKLTVIRLLFSNIWVESYSSPFDYALITISEVIIALTIIAFRRRIAYDAKDNIILNLTFMFPFFRMGAAHFFILHRISKYFINYYILALLMFPRVSKKETRFFVYFVIFGFYMVWFFFYIRGYRSFHHYQFIDFKTAFGL